MNQRTDDQQPAADDNPAEAERATGALHADAGAAAEPEGANEAERDRADNDDDLNDDELDYDYEEPRRGVPPLVAGIAGLVLLIGGALGGYLVGQRGDSGGTAADPVVATVNGEQIRRSEYDRAVAKGNGPRVLDQLVVERLIEGEAKKRGLAVSDAQVTKLRDEERARFPSEDAFQSALSQAGFTEVELLRQLRLNEFLRLMVADQIAVTDQEVEERFASSKGQVPEGSNDKLKAQLKADMIEEKTNKAVAPLIQQLKSSAQIETHLPGEGGV